MIVTVARVKGIERTSPEFLRALWAMCARQNLDADNLLAVMSAETGATFDPGIRNPKGTATGLIQFTAPTARALGTTVEALARMSQVEQLVYVERFFAPYAKKNLATRRPVDTYLAVFNPAHIGEPMSSVIYKDPDAGYKANDGFDKRGNKDGAIQVSEVAAVVDGILARARKLPPVTVELMPEWVGPVVVGVSVGILALVGVVAGSARR